MPQAAPKVSTSRGSDASKSFAVSQTGVDLTAQSGKPPFAAQRLLLSNITGAAIVAGITLVDDEGTTLSPNVPANAVLPIDTPIKTLTTPAGITTLAYWWERGDLPGVTVGRAARNS
jgi:hypothetical protein